jgi:hypothetical protein
MGKANKHTHAPWKAGESGNPAGRPVGTRIKLAEDFLLDMQAHWREHGPALIKRVNAEQPDKLLAAYVKLIPREYHVKNTSAVTELSDDNLSAMLDYVRGQLAARAPAGTELGSETADSKAKLN